MTVAGKLGRIVRSYSASDVHNGSGLGGIGLFRMRLT